MKVKLSCRIAVSVDGSFTGIFCFVLLCSRFQVIMQCASSFRQTELTLVDGIS